MTAIVITALLSSLIVYITVGFYLGARTKTLADMLPVSVDKLAHVKTSAEFSASTVATTISLATVIIAFYELAESFGLWLLWAVITTSIGLLVVRFFAKKIWEMMSVYDHRPTLHEFLGTESNSRMVSYVGAICTSMGFLGAFALEIIVGSKFFVALVPGVNPFLVLVLISLAVFLYTAVGGFRAVIVSDRLQMISVWLLLLFMPVFYIYYIINHGGWSQNFSNIPPNILNFSDRPGLTAFVLGILVINVPTFLSDMSIWQRIAGSRQPQTVFRGLVRSAFSAAASWSIIVLLACFAFMLIRPSAGTNPLLTVLGLIEQTGGLLSGIVLFFVIFGLYGAMLSTASTQLIAVSHTLYEDVLSGRRKNTLHQRIDSSRELNISRIVLVSCAVASVFVIYLLSEQRKFSIADLVFALYGSQVGLCPLVVAVLVLKKETISKLSKWSVAAISAGFFTGWATAFYGNIISSKSLAYLPPVLSLIVSTLILLCGLMIIQLNLSRWKTNLALIMAVLNARRNGLLHLAKADRPIRLDCLTCECSKCCRLLGSPVVTKKEAEKIDDTHLLKTRHGLFIKANGHSCSLLENGLCSIYPVRPQGCREYPWYNIDGELYYDTGCPGIKTDRDGRPPIETIEPFDNFFPSMPKPLIRLLKKICTRK